MDALDGLLREAGARATVFSDAAMKPPWSLRFAGRAPLSVVTMLRGDAWLMRGRAPAVPLRAGDLALVVGARPFAVTASPGADTTIVVRGPDDLTGPRGSALPDDVAAGLRAGTADLDGSDVLLSAVYDAGAHLCRRLLDGLPPVAVLPAEEHHCPLLALVGSEVTREHPGRRLVVDRLMDLVLIFAVRAWFTRPEARPPAWYSALDDPVVGKALRLLHDDPARSWTVASLAHAIGVSRANLAGRFTRQVGEPPMAYLAGWRTSLAADLLRTTEATVAAVAARVGYANAFALSAAFLRVHGVRPSEYRAAIRRGVR